MAMCSVGGRAGLRRPAPSDGVSGRLPWAPGSPFQAPGLARRSLVAAGRGRLGCGGVPAGDGGPPSGPRGSCSCSCGLSRERGGGPRGPGAPLRGLEQALRVLQDLLQQPALLILGSCGGEGTTSEAGLEPGSHRLPGASASTSPSLRQCLGRHLPTDRLAWAPHSSKRVPKSSSFRRPFNNPKRSVLLLASCSQGTKGRLRDVTSLAQSHPAQSQDQHSVRLAPEFMLFTATLVSFYSLT